ncbi:substrate-binding periplasmic protein [Spartinivicinus poritis]|uniref:Transporter substrate-binding domain-containing protein n=1 Tax=Spartinivicinus poritis TaxID=2994640 RepID=A0ABT5UD49_9GAMM|nr:transporter substrate-binding domain-containing protein [Spartinivicinus sp. A2-2]MDE1463921.1 transporter substrate-binding domain-containing protein [Spartinivicinus sp. A2-2]
MKKSSIIVIFIALFTHIAVAQPVHICRNGPEYAPYVYWERVAGKPTKTKIIGATTEFLQEIFRIVGLKYTQELIPWKRCLHEVANYGELKKYEMFTDGSYSEKRAKKYYISTPIYKLHEGLWYSKNKFPDTLPVIIPKDLNRFRLCGLAGNNYDWLLELGVTKRLDTGTIDLPSILKKLSAGRCDFYFNSLEPTYGGELVGKYTIPKDIVGVPFPGKRELTMHLFIAKSSSRAYELYTKINQAILLLQYQGIADQIYKKYTPGGTGL